jgi:hydroxymethylpyrimidine/phosphomethylpyrimidine kinase
MPRSVLIIAGSDSIAGAGIQADLKTCAALGVYGMTAITALTAQNTLGVTAIHEAPPEFVAAQIDAVEDDVRPDAVKTGMLANATIVEVVAAKVKEHALPFLVVDPVMVAKGGDRLLKKDAVRALRELLIPLADVVTPNTPEAEDLVGHPVRTDEEVRAAAREILSWGARNVVVKGGHREGAESVDVLWDGRNFHEYRATRVKTKSTHGTGCTFASAIAAFLARQEEVPDAVRHAKEYLTGALKHAEPIGHGHGPVNHFWMHDEPGLKSKTKGGRRADG